MVSEWVRYFRDADRPLEAMHAHFEHHAYHRHSHETYSFGVTESGAQSFTCRGGAHTSTTGMVMAFNPDEPHDGRAANGAGFTYRMVHIGPSLVEDVLTDRGGPAGLPLFAEPVIDDPALARRLSRLHAALAGPADPLRLDELLAAAVLSLAPRGTSAVGVPGGLARRVRSVLLEHYASPLTAGDLAAAAGSSRFAVYRAFTATYGLAPSDYQRQLRLRAARRLLAAGHPAALVAAEVGFADQSHLTRWFVRAYGLTPAAYARATS